MLDHVVEDVVLCLDAAEIEAVGEQHSVFPAFLIVVETLAEHINKMGFGHCLHGRQDQFLRDSDEGLFIQNLCIGGHSRVLEAIFKLECGRINGRMRLDAQLFEARDVVIVVVVFFEHLDFHKLLS